MRIVAPLIGALLTTAAFAASGGISRAAEQLSFEKVDAIKTPRGARLPYLVVQPKQAPHGILVMFVGGTGDLELRDHSPFTRSRSFLARTRRHFADRGYVVVLPDVPSDRVTNGLVGWRASAAHSADISAVIARLRKRWRKPVWLVGTSRGTISAAAVGSRVSGVSGVVLAAPVTRPSKRRPSTMFDSPVERIRVPVLVVHHKRSACHVAQPGDVGLVFARLRSAPRKKKLVLDGGLPAQSRACGLRSAHSFYGIELDVVGAIVAWLRSR